MKPTSMTLQLADKSITSPYGVIQDLLIKVDKFFFPVDFVVVDMEEDHEVPVILGRPFMKTARMMIDLDEGIMKIRVQDEEVKFTLFKAKKHLKNKSDIFQIDTTKGSTKEDKNQPPSYFQVGQEVLLCNSKLRCLSGKATTKWSGPLIVKDICDHGAIMVENPLTKERRTVNGKRLKDFFGGVEQHAPFLVP